jgi:hypothetical protein
MTTEGREQFEVECQEMRAINKRGLYNMMNPMPVDVVDSMIYIGTTINYDAVSCKVTLSGGDPFVNAMAIALWQTKFR